MNKLEKYQGVFPAFYACYEDNGDISPKRTEQFTEYLINKGVNGLYVGGSSGECIYQNVEERKIQLESVMRVAKGKIPVIAHIAAPSTRDSEDLARHAASLGVDAIAAIPPIYFVLPEHAIQDYWESMIKAANIDFIIYNIPGTTQYALSKNLFHQMLKNDHVIGVKNSSMPVQDILTWRLEAKKDFVIFNGPDEQYIAGRLMGANAGIGGTYAVMPELFLEAERCIKSQDLDKAYRVQEAIDDIIFTAVSGKANLYAVQKAVLKAWGMDIGGARLPLSPVTGQDEGLVTTVKNKIEKAIRTFCHE